MKNATCECCRVRRGKRRRGTFLKEGLAPIDAFVCDKCVADKHGVGVCAICGTVTWYCARVAHARDAHPDLFARMANMPDLPKPPSSGPRLLGAIDIDKLRGKS